MSSISTWQKAASTNDSKRVRYDPLLSQADLTQAIVANDPYMEREDTPQSDHVEWAEPARVLTPDPAPTPPTQGDYPEPVSRG